MVSSDGRAGDFQSSGREFDPRTTLQYTALVAQLVERTTDNRVVPSSNLGGCTNFCSVCLGDFMEKHFELIETDGKKARMTFAPSTGRFTVKIPKDMPGSESDQVKKLAMLVYSDIEAKTTLRGHVRITEKYGCEISMWDQGNKERVHYRIGGGIQ